MAARSESEAPTQGIPVVYHGCETKEKRTLTLGLAVVPGAGQRTGSKPEQQGSESNLVETDLRQKLENVDFT
ncbi:hypothetical protein NDU88_004100 [Pleurodeles waltl]|uniref:Uncharacterized protein n=1 Tax=Pleurodeles waltl TaxID=8319 RepID=A0AAV7L7M8_PLEWA|nr:hypothetical protein NDU88_004100 [Pleurodeles waltl]